MLEALDVIELYCKILIDQAAQLEKPKCVQSLFVFVFVASIPPFLGFPVSHGKIVNFWLVRWNPGNAARRSRRRRRG